MLISRSLIGWIINFTLRWIHDHESRNLFSFRRLLKCTITSSKYDFDDKVGIIRNELFYQCVNSGESLTKPTIKPFELYSICKWFAGVDTSIKSTKIKFIPITLCFFMEHLSTTAPTNVTVWNKWLHKELIWRQFHYSKIHVNDTSSHHEFMPVI